jgi:hypothetical protein
MANGNTFMAQGTKMVFTSRLEWSNTDDGMLTPSRLVLVPYFPRYMADLRQCQL